MSKSIVMALVILSAGLLASTCADAGASASAPTKYTRAASVPTWTGWLRTRRPPSEYSSINRRR